MTRFILYKVKIKLHDIPIIRSDRAKSRDTLSPILAEIDSMIDRIHIRIQIVFYMPLSSIDNKRLRS